MIRYIVRRLIAVAGILLVICGITFVIFYVLPADPATLACGRACTPERIAEIQHQLGLDRPIYQQFFDYVVGIFAGRTFGTGEAAVQCPFPCLGFSYQNNLPVWSLLMDRLPVSASIAIGAAALWLLVGLGAGVISALRKGSLWDRGAMVVALSGVSLPVYFTALVLLYVFYIRLELIPYPEFVNPFTDPAGWISAMILPWITLAFLFSAMYARLTRAGMLDTMAENYVRTARAKGLPERTVVVKHGMRAALTPVITIFGIDLGQLLGGALITETVFGMPGVGQLAYQAIGTIDQPVIMGVTLFAAFFIVFANLIVDILYAVLDPRVRYT
ncbi:MAG: ABC transporter permease subunit [Streptosporangiales bacterium]|nr:ABC transporter permease subunit [Streptosporangiales bacterium]